MQQLLVFQSLWAMESGHPGGHPGGRERPLEENLDLIHRAGFDGVSAHWFEPARVRETAAQLAARGLQAEGQCFPKTVDDLARVLDVAAEFTPHHLDVQAWIQPRRPADVLTLMEGWLRLIEQAPCPVYFETHRGRITNDLNPVLDLLDRLPGLRLLGDLSHYVVGQEIELPVAADAQAAIAAVLERCWAFHGRVASSGQVQVELSWPQHRPWVDLFLRWWAQGLRSWRRRAGPDDTLAFTCELGPRPYAITDRDGNDRTDRWAESLLMRDQVRALWRRIVAEDDGVRPSPAASSASTRAPGRS